MNISNEQKNRILKNASAKLGISEEKLNRELQKGTFDSLLNKLPQSEAKKLTGALADPKTANLILSSPQAKELIKKLFG